IIKKDSSPHKGVDPLDIDVEDFFESWKDYTNSSSETCFLEVLWCSIYQDGDQSHIPCRRNQYSQLLANKIYLEKNHQLMFFLDSRKIEKLICTLPYKSKHAAKWVDELQEMSNQGNVFANEIMSWLILLSYRISFNDIQKNCAG